MWSSWGDKSKERNKKKEEKKGKEKKKKESWSTGRMTCARGKEGIDSI